MSSKNSYKKTPADGSSEGLPEKLLLCRRILAGLGPAAVAFSGGVDSALLLALAVDVLGPVNVVAVLGRSASLPAREREAAGALAGRLGVELLEVETRELACEAYVANPPDRCYHCKTELLQQVWATVRPRGIEQVLTGANADDAGDVRPGLEALRTLGGRAPLLEAGLTKAEVREASRRMGLPTAQKPAAACLASRIPYGQRITGEKLGQVERAEDELHALGFSGCRVRHHGPAARVEIAPADMDRAFRLRRQIVRGVRAAGFTYVALDLDGFRSGSANEVLAGAGRARNGAAARRPEV